MLQQVLNSAAPALYQVLGLLIVALLSYLGAWLAAWLKAHVKDLRAQAVLLRLDDALETAVREVAMASVDAAKASGGFTPAAAAADRSPPRTVARPAPRSAPRNRA